MMTDESLKNQSEKSSRTKIEVEDIEGSDLKRELPTFANSSVPQPQDKRPMS